MNEPTSYPLSRASSVFLTLLSLFIVSFGQPVWGQLLSILSSCIGYALFFRVILSLSSAKKRFLLAALWFALVLLVQFVWVLSHPFIYIYPVLLLVVILFGAQFGIIAALINPNRLLFLHLMGFAALWTLLEWSRLFIFSGLPFNPVGLALSSQVYSLQMASWIGIYGLSFWVILTNLTVLKAWVEGCSLFRLLSMIFLITGPFIFGWYHLLSHEKAFLNADSMHVLVVQPDFAIDEQHIFQSIEEARRSVLTKWKHIFLIIRNHLGKEIDLMVLPEYVVPYGTFSHVYPLEEVKELFEIVFGDVSKNYSAHTSYAVSSSFAPKPAQFVSNAYIVQTLANLFDADVIIGLEDSVYEKKDDKLHRSQSFSSAFFFRPEKSQHLPRRYEKRILVPMGEYIPFDYLRHLASHYGISGSFTAGAEVKVFKSKTPFGCSICYEELFSHLTRENRLDGAELLVNLTNDGWFPNSFLPQQHFDHAKLRTIENGMPLVRASNTGISGAIDSFGRIVAILEANCKKIGSCAGSLLIDVPLYHYQTFYTQYGDFAIVIFSLFVLLACFTLNLFRLA